MDVPYLMGSPSNVAISVSGICSACTISPRAAVVVVSAGTRAGVSSPAGLALTRNSRASGLRS